MTEPRRLYTPSDMEERYQIPRGTQAAMRSRGQIPFLRLGGGRLIRYAPEAIAEWLAERSVAVRK